MYFVVFIFACYCGSSSFCNQCFLVEVKIPQIHLAFTIIPARERLYYGIYYYIIMIILLFIFALMADTSFLINIVFIFLMLTSSISSD